MSCTIDELKKKYNEYRLITNRLRRDKGFTVQEAEFEKYVKEKTKVSRGIFTKIESEGRYFGNKSLTGETVASMRYHQLIFNPYQINNVLFNSILGMIHAKTKSSYNMNSRKFELIFGKDKTFKTNLNSEDIKNINDFVKLIDPKALIIDDKQSKIYLPFIEFNMIDNLYNRIIKEHRNIIPLFYNRKKGEKLKVKFLFYLRDFCRLLDDFFSKVPENLKNNFRSYILEGAKKGAVAGGKLVAGALVKGSRSAGGIAYDKTKVLIAFLKQKFNSLPEAKAAILSQLKILEALKDRFIKNIRSRSKAGSDTESESRSKAGSDTESESRSAAGPGSGPDTVGSPTPLTKKNLKLHDTATSSDTSSLFGASVAASSDTSSDTTLNLDFLESNDDTITTINKDISFLSKLLESTNKQISSYAGAAAAGVNQAYVGLISIPGLIRGAYYNPKRKASVGAPPEENKKNKNNQYKNMFSRIFRKAREQAKRFQDYTSAKSQQFSNYAQNKKRQLSRSASFYGQQLKGYVKGRPTISGPVDPKFNPYEKGPGLVVKEGYGVVPPPPPMPGSLQHGVQNPQLKTKNTANIIRNNSEEQRMANFREEYRKEKLENQRMANIAQKASKQAENYRQLREETKRKAEQFEYNRLDKECTKKKCSPYSKSECIRTSLGRKVCKDKAEKKAQLDRIKKLNKPIAARNREIIEEKERLSQVDEERKRLMKQAEIDLKKDKDLEKFNQSFPQRSGKVRDTRAFSGTSNSGLLNALGKRKVHNTRKQSPKKRSRKSKK